MGLPSLIPLFLTNVGVAYNLAVVGLVIVAMQAHLPVVQPKYAAAVATAGMVGAVVGQLLVGFLGDVIGVRRALFLTTVVLVVGSILSASLPKTDGLPNLQMSNGTIAAAASSATLSAEVEAKLFTFFQILTICRFVVGIGVGGAYPLTAVASREPDASSGQALSNSTRRALLVFAGQGWGQLLAPVTMYGLSYMIPSSEESVWRIALGLGAVPSLVTVLIGFVQAARRTLGVEDYIISVAGDHPDNIALREGDRQVREEVLVKPTLCGLLCNWQYVKKLIGTGGTWFLFDVTFYANVVFAPLVLERVFGLKQDGSNASAGAGAIAGPTALAILAGLPGYYLAVALGQSIGLKRMQVGGFVCLAALYLALALTISSLSSAVLFTMYAGTFFFSNFGPNSSTFCLPSETFPKEARATYNGLSAALGKTGAIVGTAVFPIILADSGIAAVLGFSAGVAFVGAVLTIVAVDGNFHPNRMGDGNEAYVDVELSQAGLDDNNHNNSEGNGLPKGKTSSTSNNNNNKRSGSADYQDNPFKKYDQQSAAASGAASSSSASPSLSLT